MGEQEDLRWQRLLESADDLMNCRNIVIDATRLTVGEGELLEYEHVPIKRRFAEMAIFYYWWVCQLIFNATTYEYKADYAQWLADALMQALPGTAAILQERWVEYDDGTSTVPKLEDRATIIARRALLHIDPRARVTDEFARMLGVEATAGVTTWFREQTSFETRAK